MTARALIDRRFRVVMRRIYVGMGLFFVFLIAQDVVGLPGWTWGVGLVGFAVAWISMAAAWLVGFRCPTCRGRLTGLLMQRGGFRMDPRVRFCPYCGREFDAEAQTGGAVA